ncbi:MAG: hypothetical protein DMG23_01115 [Acidobacteria bacterium]|nr:MAG: hypothetical protein DMG23_01115 [Acidobacteriota bacterium]
MPARISESDIAARLFRQARISMEVIFMCRSNDPPVHSLLSQVMSRPKSMDRKDECQRLRFPEPSR